MNRSERRKAAKAARKQGRRAGVEAAPIAVQEAFQAAVQAYQAGRPGEAEDLLCATEADYPGISDVSHLRGVIALQGGHHEMAAGHLGRAVAADRRNPALHHLLGMAYHRLGQVEDGAAAFRKAISIDAGNSEPHFAMGNLLREAGRFAEAVACYEAALEIDPDYGDAHYNLGLSLSSLDRWDEARTAYEAVLAQTPDQVDAQTGLCRALAMLGNCVEAEHHARAAIAIMPAAFEAHSNLALALQGQGRTEEAESALRTALGQQPDRAALHVNMGNILKDKDDVAGAESSYRRAIELAPDDAGAHVSLGALLLTNGRDEEGWQAYDWRWKIPGHASRPYPQPRWNGSDLTGRTILAWADEGAGDEIQFASLLPEVIARAGSCIVECDRRLVPVFERSFPGAEIHARRDKPDKKLLSDAIDFQTPFSELPRWLRPDLAAAPRPDKSYLLADSVLANACRARYRDRGEGLTVGIAWASGNLHRPGRNAPLALWEQILTQPGVQFVSLQYGDHTAELAETRDRFGVDIFVDPEINQMASLEQFAAQVTAMDLIVSITNTTVHMAGALGRPVWTMLPNVAHWRYRRDTGETLWYPHMRLFRQTRPWVWDDVMEQVAGELATFRAAAG